MKERREERRVPATGCKGEIGETWKISNLKKIKKSKHQPYAVEV